MRACIVCHKFIKQPQYCPKHEPRSDTADGLINSQLNDMAQQGGIGGAFGTTTQMQSDLRAQQFGGLGGSSLQAALARGALGQFHPGQMIPVDQLTPTAAGPLPSWGPNMKWLIPALSWVLNPLTKLGLWWGIVKEE